MRIDSHMDNYVWRVLQSANPVYQDAPCICSEIGKQKPLYMHMLCEIKYIRNVCFAFSSFSTESEITTTTCDLEHPVYAITTRDGIPELRCFFPLALGGRLLKVGLICVKIAAQIYCDRT